jgi:fructosamine-3-kinase
MIGWSRMSQEMDISWQWLRQVVKEWGGDTAEPAEVQPLTGGGISTTLAISLTDHRKAVLKVSPHRVDHGYVNEAHQLGLLADLGLPTPKVYAARVGSLDDPFSYILMEYIEGYTLHHARRLCNEEQYDAIQAHLAELMLALHERTGTDYRRLQIEAPPQAFDNWAVFYRHVFDPICEETLQLKAIPLKCRKMIGRVHERLEKLLNHDDVPRLVHWDVWATNILVRPSQAGDWRVVALLDPNCKFAHVEAEIAYMSLFHTSTPAFMKAYQQKRRFSDDYHRVRKLIYQVYFLLNEVSMFGAEHVKELLPAAERLAVIV